MDTEVSEPTKGKVTVCSDRDVACGPPGGGPYEPGSLNAKQWLRSLKNRKRL